MSTAIRPTIKQHAIPFFVPSLGDEEIGSVVETLRSGWLTMGPKVKEFEQLFAERVQARHALATNSCTAALTLALEAIGVGRGDEVLVPTLTFASTAEVVVHLGAKPVLVDCLPDTLAIDPEDAKRKVTPATKVIVPVHYGGQPCNMAAILNLARDHQLKVVEDAAHALPARYGDRTVGSIGDCTCFSFYANKTITTGEGGMVTTNDDDIAERIRVMTLHGISKDAWKRFSSEGSWYYEITGPGYKFNMTDIAAAMGIHQLDRVDEFWLRRQQIAELYDEAFLTMPELAIPTVELNVQHSWHLYVVQLNLATLNIDRNRFIELLNEAGIGTSVHYLPLHMHPYYRSEFGYQPGNLPIARSIFERIISLPIYPKMTNADVGFVIDTVKRIAKSNGR